ncbi:MAG: hypothetical protein KBC47_03740 [Candidatus Peribacteraceae bacterium]|nr:hypothetical protein [Candidatus Peribacteraceae bacterium]
MHRWGVSSFEGTGTSVVATAAAAETKIVGTAPIDPPAGFIFDPVTGNLKAPAPIPAGYVLVLKYESTDQPLKGGQELKGRYMGPGQTWKLPKDATEIEAMYWNKKANEVTGFVVPF